MKLMRNVTPDGQCKYAAVRMDKLTALDRPEQFLARGALAQLAALGLLENPAPGEQEEFFLIKLKDNHAAAALWAYANSIHGTDPEFSDEVAGLARRSRESAWRKEPDTAPAAYGVQVPAPTEQKGGA
jgi:hypothetical protein